MHQILISAVLGRVTKTGLFASGLGFRVIINMLNGERTATAQLVNRDACANGEQAANNDVKPSHMASVGAKIAPRNVTYAKLLQNLCNKYTTQLVFSGGATC